MRFAVPGSKYKLFAVVGLLCDSATAAQCHKLFFHWAAKNSHWAAFLPTSYNAKRGYGNSSELYNGFTHELVTGIEAI